jgi:hypothetical protein
MITAQATGFLTKVNFRSDSAWLSLRPPAARSPQPAKKNSEKECRY